MHVPQPEGPKNNHPNPLIRSTGPSHSEQLQSEFRQKFIWADFVEYYRKFLNQHFPNNPEIRENYLKILGEHRIGAAHETIEEYEFKFANRIIAAYVRWSKEANVVVLWDIDETIGADPTYDYGNLGRVGSAEIRWGFRPCFLHLIEFLGGKFPDIKNGILSGRGLFEIREQLDDPMRLAAAKKFFDPKHIYSAGRNHGAKIEAMTRLRNQGQLNAKSIDDDIDLSKMDSATGKGVAIGDCFALYRYSILLAK